MTELNPKLDKGPPLDKGEQQQQTFEDFSSGADWRALPLDIKLKVLKLVSAERDTPRAD